MNLDYLNHITKHDPVLMRRMISLYLEQTPPLISELRRCLESGDWAILQATAHKLLPSFSIVGIDGECVSATRQMMTYTGTEQSPHQMKAGMSCIEDTFIRIEADLNKVLSNFTAGESLTT